MSTINRFRRHQTLPSTSSDVGGGLPAPPPTSLNAIPGYNADSEVNLTWIVNSGASSYDLQFNLNGGSYSSVPGSPLSGTADSYAFTNLFVFAQYCFRIASINGNGIGAYTAPVCVVTVGDPNAG